MIGNTLTYRCHRLERRSRYRHRSDGQRYAAATVDFVSATPAGYTVAGRVVTFTNLGNLDSRAQDQPHHHRPADRGRHLHQQRHLQVPRVTDPHKANNSASVKTIVQLVPLTVARLGTSNLVISWPANGGNYVLESTTDLQPPVAWAPVTDAIMTLVGGQTRVDRAHRPRQPVLPLALDDLAGSGPEPVADRQHITIAWPVNPWNAYLETKANLSASSWTPATNPPPTVVGDQNTVTLTHWQC